GFLPLLHVGEGGRGDEVQAKITLKMGIQHKTKQKKDTPAMLYPYLTRATQQKPALITPHGSYTYADLREAIQHDMAQLREWGIQTGDVVAILAHNHPVYVRMIIALWELGAIPLPLNTRLTGDEIRYQVEFARAKCLIVADDMAMPDVDVAVYAFPLSPQPPFPIEWRKGGQKSPLSMQWGGDLGVGCIMFTSGTSGKPKGAMLTHDNLIANALASHERLSMTADDHWLCVLPLYHIGGLSIIVRCFMLGGTVSLFPRFDADSVHHALSTRPITLISLVPTMLYRLLDKDVSAWSTSLRLILLGGAAADDRLMRRCADFNLPVATTYGLTEASSQVCTATPNMTYRKPASVGKPMNGISVRIVDEHGATCPIGAIGEICVRGKTVMAGYYHDDLSTAKTLRDGELFTGDMGYLDADGDLWVIQRRSDLIVTGGENVYPAEIEAVLRGFIGVDDVAVVGISDPEWGQVVACALVGAVDIPQLQADLRGKLAGYKIPRRWLVLDTLPLNSTGKVDKNAICALFG
ncbi:MAG: o-succinylbenzoate--CoA ligase, partial [Anaerolineae bacterium]|nr:o-succinylbenzoate--CoA ligase [Anaerolineae bacterium]